ncbi:MULTISPECIES: glycoside hydrolase family 25 protein [unclassified Janthinobacterium]|uniref:glycoside hydrolase family 25 protein n=1 Tax=unclassified Janthinobacterium TaxID=2610881 RepID=UPI001606FE38|nr:MULTISPECIES: glycoside hydrolase family 25 protein [unclassified Janthinobacterium]MBB5606460.1 lysozyme [Janthinobacterium sp. S3T4]MBB5611668.1 lysozyme [Janthinobacterium sp. S3M3]
MKYLTDAQLGIDVSHYNGDIDWAKVAADKNKPKFVYMKATEGRSIVDAKYQDNRKRAKEHGLLCGAYHFFVPEVPVQEQVEHFCKVVGSVEGELPPMLDVEHSGLAKHAYAAALMQWLQQAGDRLKCVPGIYAGPYFWNSNVGSFTPFLASPLWISNFTQASHPLLMSGATSYTFWQYTDSTKIDGIAGKVDMDRYAGSLAQLKTLLCGQQRTLITDQSLAADGARPYVPTRPPIPARKW